VIKRFVSQTPFVYPSLGESPYVSNKFLTIGCFNRVNKITDSVIAQYNKVLVQNSNIKFIFKTKALINKNIQKVFLDKFDEHVRDRIQILDCTLSHEQHLDTYNLVDIAIDTFPYSGTTTSCEALFMGVPVLSMYDSKYQFHPQNVTCSILKNSNMEEYIFNNTDQLLDKIVEMEKRDSIFWNSLKKTIRDRFLNGLVCNKSEYMTNIQQLFVDIHKKHSPL
jgi:predicted O-linked N-acetylglucosamine transferase (SPINDLY family)